MLITLMRVALPVALTVTPVATAPARPSSDFSLTVSPSRIIVPADQAARPRQFTVTNRGRDALDVTVRLSGFAASPDGGLLLRSDAPHSAAGWVTVTPDRFRLPARKATRIGLRVSIPDGAGPGEHQVAVLFSTPPPEGGTDIGVARSVGATVYVSAPGPVDDSVEITSLRAPGFTLGGPLTLAATIRNTGTRHRDFVGDDRLQARTAGASLPFPDFTLLRDETREIRTRWTDPPLICVCRASLAVPGSEGTESATATVVVLPVHLIGPVLALLLLLPLLGWLLRRRAARTRRPAGTELSLAGGGHA